MTTDRRQLIEQFAEAWGSRDVDAVMALMTADCSFSQSVGPEPGHSYVGADAVRQGVESFLTGPPDSTVTTRIVATLIADHFAVVRWESTQVGADGRAVETKACDVFEFDGDRVKSKDTYRKVQS